MKLKLLFVSLVITLAQITPSDAQSILPAGHYTKKRGGAGEMRVEKSEGGWRVLLMAGGIPRGGYTAADCALMLVGAIEGNTFQGEVKYLLDFTEFEGAKRKVVLDYLKGGSSKPPSIEGLEAGLKMTITFAPQFATVNDVDWGMRDPCPMHSGILGRYTKDRKRLPTRDCKSRPYSQLFNPACDGT